MSPLNKLVKGDIFIMGSIFKAAQDASKSCMIYTEANFILSFLFIV